jgi:hypothetical protein
VVLMTSIDVDIVILSCKYYQFSIQINVDVSVETPQVDVIDDVSLPNLGLGNQMVMFTCKCLFSALINLLFLPIDLALHLQLLTVYVENNFRWGFGSYGRLVLTISASE